MRVALAIPTVTLDWRTNVATMCSMAAQAAARGATVIVFSEASVSGFINTGDPDYDMTLGQPIPGPATEMLHRAATTHHIWIGAGLFEQAHHLLYDCYIVVSPGNAVASLYRRIDPHWHHWHSRPCNNMIYDQGEQITSISLPIGLSTFLLCGDLFNDLCLEQVEHLHPEWLIVPMARGFDSEVYTQEQWYTADRYHYVERARQANVNMLLVNQLSSYDPEFAYFGGAMVVTKDGTIRSEYPLEQEGLLIVDITTL